MENLEKNQLIGISALLVHAAKADDNYTDQEKKSLKTLFYPKEQKKIFKVFWIMQKKLKQIQISF